MNTQLLIQSIGKHISLTKEEEDFFLSILRSKKIKRKQYLFQEGEINKTVTFVSSGILRLYSLDKNGFEHIIQFAPKGWWIGDMQSYLKQQPGSLYIDAIEESEVIQILRADMEKLYDTVPKFERHFRVLAENALGVYQQRFANSLSLSAKERYQNFCELYPSLVQNLPQKYIASFIGVTPEFLSKMLSQLSLQKK
jgi:CRP-like cAMP-binding protein